MARPSLPSLRSLTTRSNSPGSDELYRGEWDSLEAYAEQWLDEVGVTDTLDAIPELLQPYVNLDVAGFARDLRLGGDIQTVERPDGGIWVFEGNAR